MVTKEGGEEVPFQTGTPSLDLGTQETTVQHKEGEIVVPVEALNIFSVTAHTAFAKLAEIRGMMRGIHLVPNIND